MGCLGSKVFVANTIDGQTEMDFEDMKTIGLDKTDVDKLFSVFAKHDTTKDGVCDFVLGTFNFLTRSEESLIKYAFNLYDHGQKGSLPTDTLKALVASVHEIHGERAETKQARDMYLKKAFSTLTPDYNDLVTLHDFSDCCRKFSQLLFPAMDAQSKMRAHIVGEDFWTSKTATADSVFSRPEVVAMYDKMMVAVVNNASLSSTMSPSGKDQAMTALFRSGGSVDEELMDKILTGRINAGAETTRRLQMQQQASLQRRMHPKRSVRISSSGDHQSTVESPGSSYSSSPKPRTVRLSERQVAKLPRARSSRQLQYATSTSMSISTLHESNSLPI